MIKTVPSTAKILRSPESVKNTDSFVQWFNSIDSTVRGSTEFYSLRGDNFQGFLTAESATVKKSVGVLVTAWNKFNAGKTVEDYQNQNTGTRTDTAADKKPSDTTKSPKYLKNTFVRVINTDSVIFTSENGSLKSEIGYNTTTRQIGCVLSALTVGIVKSLYDNDLQTIAAAIERDENGIVFKNGYKCGLSTSESAAAAISAESNRLQSLIVDLAKNGDFSAIPAAAAAMKDMTAIPTEVSKIAVFCQMVKDSRIAAAAAAAAEKIESDKIAAAAAAAIQPIKENSI